MIPIRDSIKSRKFPIINSLFLIANIAVFIFQLKLNSASLLDPFILNFSLIPSQFLRDPFDNAYRLISSQFLHGGLAHIVGNMIFLYIFGDNVEDKLGHIKYLFFYLGAGIAASSMQMYITPSSNIPMLGASGAIAGVLGVYFLYYPRARVTTLSPLGFFSRIIDIPAFFFLGIWFIIQAFSGTSSLYIAHAVGHDTGGVAWWAHIGGFAFGVIVAIMRKLI